MQGPRLDDVRGFATVLGVHQFSSAGPAKSTGLRPPKPDAKKRISSRTGLPVDDPSNTHNITPLQTR